MKTSSAATSMSTKTKTGGGTNALDLEQEEDSLDDEDCSTEVELDKAWRHITSAKQAKDAAKKRYHSMRQWRLTHCNELFCGSTPDLTGAARMSNNYFTNVEVAEVATLVSWKCQKHHHKRSLYCSCAGCGRQLLHW